jgi:hypothetical protein
MSQLLLYTASQAQDFVTHTQTVPGYMELMEASDMELEIRDVFLGERRCVICGIANPSILQHCCIISGSDIETVCSMCS